MCSRGDADELYALCLDNKGRNVTCRGGEGGGTLQHAHNLLSSKDNARRQVRPDPAVTTTSSAATAAEIRNESLPLRCHKEPPPMAEVHRITVGEE